MFDTAGKQHRAGNFLDAIIHRQKEKIPVAAGVD
jgi:hypothetical protein